MMDKVRTRRFTISSLLPETKELLLYFDVAPTRERTFLINSCIADLIDSLIWSQLDFLPVMASHSELSALVDWKNPYRSMVRVNAPTFTTDRGFLFNGTSQYLRTGFNPSTASKYTLNLNTFGFYSRTNSNVAGVDIGSFNGVSSRGDTLHARQSGNFISRNNSSSQGVVANSDSLALHVSKRIDSASIELWKRNVKLSTAAVASVAVENLEFYSGALNVSAVASNFSAREHAYNFAGGDINIIDFNSIMETYLTAIGANV
jgi:hypothetical protein